MSVRFGLLGLLAQQPRHGYELYNAFTAAVGGEENWEIKPAQVYTTLSRLKDSGLVQEVETDEAADSEKRSYILTSEGRRALEEWFTTAIVTEHQRDEFFVKLMLSLYTGIVPPHKVIQTQRVALYQQLHTVTTRRQRIDAQNALAQILLLDKTVMYLEADLRWLDMIESRLDDLQRQPLPQPEMRPRGRPRLK